MQWLNFTKYFEVLNVAGLSHACQHNFEHTKASSIANASILGKVFCAKHTVYTNIDIGRASKILSESTMIILSHYSYVMNAMIKVMINKTEVTYIHM